MIGHTIVGTFIVWLLALLGSVAHDVATINNDPVPVVHCAYEDSPGPCIWDAQVDGNGEGRSFVNTPGRHPKYLP